MGGADDVFALEKDGAEGLQAQPKLQYLPIRSATLGDRDTTQLDV